MILIRLANVFWIQREKSTRKINLSLAMLIKLVVASDKNGKKVLTFILLLRTQRFIIHRSNMGPRYENVYMYQNKLLLDILFQIRLTF